MPTSERSITQQASHQLYVIRLSAMTANKSNELFDSYEKLALEITSKLKPGSIKTYTDVLKDLLETTGYFSEYQKEVNSDISEFAAYEAAYQAALLEDLFVNQIPVVVPKKSDVMDRIKNTPMILGERDKDVITWKQMIASIDESARRGVESAVTRAYFSGDISGLRKLVSQAVETARNGVRATVKTMYQQAASQSKQALYRANDDLVIGYQIIATLDSHTTPICVIRSNKKYYYKDNFNPMLPFHYGERSTDIPILSGEYQIDRISETRGARGADGAQKVGADTTQMEFIKSQPVEWQDDALGKVRADLLRNSGLTPEQFKKAMSDQFDQPLTLKQMAAKDKAIRDYMAKKPEYERYL